MCQRAAHWLAIVLLTLFSQPSYARGCDEANEEAISIYETIRKSDSRSESFILSLSLSNLAKKNSDCIIPAKLSKAASETLGQSRITSSSSGVCPDDRACIVEKKRVTNNTAEGTTNPVDQ